MRLYTFTNCYLSGAQVGIQSLHVTSDMFVKYSISPATIKEAANQQYALHAWAKEHKTVICLNGGNAASLREQVLNFENEENPYPWCAFREDEDSLDGIVTSVGIVLPQKIYEAAAVLNSQSKREQGFTINEMMEDKKVRVSDPKQSQGSYLGNVSYWEIELIKSLGYFRLAS